MAYIDQEKKGQIAARVKAICKRHGLKASLAVRHHSTLVLTISEGPIDFIGDLARDQYSPERIESIESSQHLDVNPYHWHRTFTGLALAFLGEVMPVLNDGNHDNSDPQTDYYDVGWYVAVQVGRWNKPYSLTVPRLADRILAAVRHPLDPPGDRE
jgi:hypothetical protein